MMMFGEYVTNWEGVCTLVCTALPGSKESCLTTSGHSFLCPRTESEWSCIGMKMKTSSDGEAHGFRPTAVNDILLKSCSFTIDGPGWSLSASAERGARLASDSTFRVLIEGDTEG